MEDCNIKELRQLCYRQSKVPGEFMLQLRCAGNYMDSKWLEMVQHVCQTWGDGNFHIGTRLTFDIPGIKAKYVPEVNAYIEPFLYEMECNMCGVEMDTSKGYPYIGPRNVVACIGGIHCIKANINTQEMAHKIEKLIYPNPYHVKIGLGGCPNDCVKAQFQDIGIVGVTRPVYDASRCIACGACVKKCQKVATGVLEMNDQGTIDKDTCCCVGCGECVGICPTGAWSRQEQVFYKIYIGGRSGKQFPRMGKMFANWLSEEAVLQIIANWPAFSEWALEGKAEYLHGGHLIDRAGYQRFKEFMLDGVELNEEALIADNVYWAEQEYRSNIHLKPLDKHMNVK